MQYICLRIGFDYNEICLNRGVVENGVEKKEVRCPNQKFQRLISDVDDYREQ